MHAHRNDRVNSYNNTEKNTHIRKFDILDQNAMMAPRLTIYLITSNPYCIWHNIATQLF